MASGWRCSKHLVFAPAAKGTNTCSIFERELNNFATLPRPTMGPFFFFFCWIHNCYGFWYHLLGHFGLRHHLRKKNLVFEFKLNYILPAYQTISISSVTYCLCGPKMNFTPTNFPTCLSVNFLLDYYIIYIWNQQMYTWKN